MRSSVSHWAGVTRPLPALSLMQHARPSWRRISKISGQPARGAVRPTVAHATSGNTKARNCATARRSANSGCRLAFCLLMIGQITFLSGSLTDHSRELFAFLFLGMAPKRGDGCRVLHRRAGTPEERTPRVFHGSTFQISLRSARSFQDRQSTEWGKSPLFQGI